jgi:acid phosphatase class B
MKRVFSVLSAIVFLFTMALPVMASQKTAQPHHSSTAAAAKSEKSPHEAMSSTHKATLRHAGNSSHRTKKTQKKG